MKKLLAIFSLLLCVGCANDIDQKHIKAGQFLCFDQDGVAEIVIDPITADVYVCNDGAQFVVSYNGNGEYYIRHNQDEAVNAMLHSILKRNQ
jgi:hypothetical protein